MNLTNYLGRLISDKACELSKLCLSNDELNCNFKEIMNTYRELGKFIKDYDEFSRTNDII